MCLLAGGVAFAADTVNLSVSHGGTPGSVVLRWVGGATPYGVFRSTSPINVTDPANQIGQTGDTQWPDLPPNARILYYAVIGPNCPAGLIPCGGGCVDPLTDAQNCGGCGISCDDGSNCTRDFCSAGTCRRVDRAACANTDGGCGPQGCGACGFSAVYPGCADPDSDGDGLGDKWEEAQAIDIDCDGDYDSNDVSIPGANPRVKDVYLKISWMGSAPSEPPDQHKPSPEAVDWVIAAFAGAHLTQPPVRCDAAAQLCPPGYACSVQDFVCLPECNLDTDCQSGVCVGGVCREWRLHVDIAPSGIPHYDVVSFGAVQPACMTGGDVSKGINFYDIKTGVFNPKEALFKHFGMIGHFQTCDSPSTCDAPACVGVGGEKPVYAGSGLAEQYGNDWMVTLGGFPDPPDPINRSLREAGALLHELGHNLGLEHGGSSGSGESPKRPPNYISVMNHSYNFGIPVAETPGSVVPSPDPRQWRVDFSHSALGSLDESNLVETNGVSPGNPPPYDRDLLRYLSTGFGDGTRYGSTQPGQPINWKVNDPILSSPVQVNLNDDPPGGPPSEVMPGVEDWSRLAYAYQCQPAFLDGVSPGVRAVPEIDPQTAVRYDLLDPPLIARLDVQPQCIDSSSHGVAVPDVIYGSSDFDVQQIDLSTLRLAEALPIDSSVMDDNSDGYLDLKANFRQDDMVLTPGDMLVVVRGKLLGGRSFLGEDLVHVASPPESCSPICALGTADCNGIASDGCETNLARAQSNSPDLFGGGDVPSGYTRVPVVTDCGACNQGCDDGSSCTTDLCVPVQGLGECRHYNRAMCAFSRCGLDIGDPACAGPDSDTVQIGGATVAAPDGLPDAWETAQPNPYSLGMNPVGVDINCDGVIDGGGPLGVDLALPDSSPVRPDLYVAYDYMTGSGAEASHKPLDGFIDVGPGSNDTGAVVPGAIERVTSAFADKGIALHMQVNVDPQGVPTSTDDATTRTPHRLVVTFCPNTDLTFTPDAITFAALKQAHFDSRRRFTHKYMVYGHFSQCAGPGDCPPCTPAFCGPSKFQASGMAEMGGNDFMVTLGGQNYSVDLGSTVGKDTLIRYQAGTIAHEMGHTFGLNHGGAHQFTGDPCTATPAQNSLDRKPNYLSSMNHRYQLSGITTAPLPGSVTAMPAPWSRPGAPEGSPGFIPLSRCDFSSMLLPTLDENRLTEPAGISPCPVNPLRDIITYSSPTGAQVRGPGCGPVDWNLNGSIDPIQVRADINNSGNDPVVYEVLEGFDDWGYLFSHMSFQCGSSFSDGVAPPPAD